MKGVRILLLLFLIYIEGTNYYLTVNTVHLVVTIVLVLLVMFFIISWIVDSHLNKAREQMKIDQQHDIEFTKQWNELHSKKD